MDILSSFYSKKAAEAETDLRFWEEYLNNLKSVKLDSFSDKLTVPVLVPIGKRILFRGEIKHTNEVIVSLGASYFAKCSLKQAEILRQHKIKDAQSKVDIFRKEKDYLNKQISFSKENIYENIGQEIVESYNEEEEKEWRKRHRENVKQYKIRSKDEQPSEKDLPNDELWDRLDELELQEELENELLGVDDQKERIFPATTSVKKEENVTLKIHEDKYVDGCSTKEENNKNNTVNQKTNSTTISRLDLLQKVLDRQNELEEKLHELKCKGKKQTRTEEDLLTRLDEMEQLDELEDEMDRLDDIIEDEDVEYEEADNNIKTPDIKLKRSVSFADEDDSETLEITFKHSQVSPTKELYNAIKGIQKPSDIYEAYANLFIGETAILKKSKYECDKNYVSITINNSQKEPEEDLNKDYLSINKTIVVRDVMEKVEQTSNVEISKSRPTSIFKKKRMQNKS